MTSQDAAAGGVYSDDGGITGQRKQDDGERSGYVTCMATVQGRGTGCDITLQPLPPIHRLTLSNSSPSITTSHWSITMWTTPTGAKVSEVLTLKSKLPPPCTACRHTLQIFIIRHQCHGGSGCRLPGEGLPARHAPSSFLSGPYITNEPSLRHVAGPRPQGIPSAWNVCGENMSV